jgi:hypothetical protein
MYIIYYCSLTYLFDLDINSTRLDERNNWFVYLDKWQNVLTKNELILNNVKIIYGCRNLTKRKNKNYEVN